MELTRHLHSLLQLVLSTAVKSNVVVLSTNTVDNSTEKSTLYIYIHLWNEQRYSFITSIFIADT